jgi:hypothetical protein
MVFIQEVVTVVSTDPTEEDQAQTHADGQEAYVKD